MYTDARGLTLTTSSEAAAGHFSDAIDDYLDYRLSASAKLKMALDEDPDFVMALYFRTCFLQMLETGAVLPKVNQALEGMKQRLGAVTARERGHVLALEAWAQGDIIGACRIWEDILVEHPLDILALKLHHYLTFWTGRSYAMRGCVARALPAWDADTPGYASIQGMYAFGLEECGEYDAAERWGREAVERNGEDLWAIHSVAHVLEMQGRSAEGVTWLDYADERWAGCNPFIGHIWWHAGLFNLAQGNYDKVLSLYDDQMCAVNSKFFVDMQNQVSLLKRLELRGVDVGDRWEVLADHGETRIDDHILAFNDVHFCLALAAAGRSDHAQRHIASMAAFGEGAHNGGGWTAITMAATTVPLCQALIAYEKGDYGNACDILWPLKDDIASIGGSHAQRDMFAQILCDAALRDGRFAMARSLFSERISLRPSSGMNWQCYADALDGLGEGDVAAAARAQAETASEPAA
jgi:tetratricopeptide (TPR) repeat protein